MIWPMPKKRRSCALCKPHKMGWEKRWKVKEAERLRAMDQETDRMKSSTPVIFKDLIAQHGLSEEEYKKILDIFWREPRITELGTFSVMWSEHGGEGGTN